MTNTFTDIEKSNLILVEGTEGGDWRNVWAVFDVSPTIEALYIAIHWESSNPNSMLWRSEILKTFDGYKELLAWCADLQKENSDFEIRAGEQSEFEGTEWLDQECQKDGWDSWKDFVKCR